MSESTTEIIGIGGEPHEIEVKPITLIFKGPEVPDVEYPERVKLDIDACLYHIDRVQKFDPRTPKLIAMCFPEYEGEITPDVCRQNGLGWRHVGGRMDMSLKLSQMNVPIAWVFPEAGLHPKVQLVLADILIMLSKGEI